MLFRSGNGCRVLVVVRRGGGDFFDSSGVARATAKQSAERPGMDDMQAIHHALHELALRVFPKYEDDEGPLPETQVRQIKKRVSRGGQTFGLLQPLRSAQGGEVKEGRTCGG